MATVLLGWLVPVTVTADIKTSETFKVLTDGDNMGGSCDSRRNDVDALVPEVQQLIMAASNAIDTITKNPPRSELLSPTKRKDRLRIFLLARWFFGTKFNSVLLTIDSSSKGTLNSVKGQIPDVF